MKKSFLLVTAALLTTGLFTLNSCDKVKDQLFKAFTANGGSVDFTIPIITNTSTTQEIGNVMHNFNVDSIIKAETGGAFSLDDIEKVTVEEAVVVIKNADADNNFANFEDGNVQFSTNTKPVPVTINTGPNPDVFSSSFTIPSVAGINLKEYLQGTVLHYVMNGKMRRATTKTLDCTLTVKFRIEN